MFVKVLFMNGPEGFTMWQKVEDSLAEKWEELRRTRYLTITYLQGGGLLLALRSKDPSGPYQFKYARVEGRIREKLSQLIREGVVL